MKYFLWLIVAIIIIGALTWGIISSNVEQQKYEVVIASLFRKFVRISGV